MLRDYDPLNLSKNTTESFNNVVIKIVTKEVLDVNDSEKMLKTLEDSLDNFEVGDQKVGYKTLISLQDENDLKVYYVLFSLTKNISYRVQSFANHFGTIKTMFDIEEFLIYRFKASEFMEVFVEISTSCKAVSVKK